MKKLFSILISALIIYMIPFTTIWGQEMQRKQKIKIVVSDDSGTKVIIDTLLTGDQPNDSIRTKDGRVIFIGDSGDNSFMKKADGSGHVYVYTSQDENGQDKETKTINIITSDSGSWTTKTDEGDKKNIEKIIVISEGGDSEKELENSFDTWVEKEKMESTQYKSRSIIAKNGMVVTIEGDDEAKIQALSKEIQEKMGEQQDDKDFINVEKVETKSKTKR